MGDQDAQGFTRRRGQRHRPDQRAGLQDQRRVGRLPDRTPRPGYKYGAILARGCLVAASGTTVGFSWAPWTLTGTDGTTLAPLDSYSDEVLIAPLYPNDSNRTTAVGQCRKGSVPFAVPNGWRPSGVEYEPEGEGTLTWRL